VVFLGCGAPLESSIPLFPLMRIGADTKEAWDPLSSRLIGHMGRPSAYINLKDTIGRAFMNRALYFNDPDVVFMRGNNCSLSTNEKETIAAAAMMFSSQIMISDDVGHFGGPGEKELTARTLALFKALEGREYGALMFGKDLWRCFSRDDEVRGVINLRRSAARISAKDAAAWKLSGEKILDHARRDKAGLVVSPRSAALWR
jgi:alpha-galactosidase